MSTPDGPTPQQPTAPGGADDHNKDLPRDGGADRADRPDRDRDRISDPGGDSDPDPAR